ncbi:winged helix-turn-helix domain-containing protein [Marinactinospora thermotolerans]|uniref:Helix-turn-helix domain-containing protein n=1 Tax=Marinactinospora thermotolerans DSM 45154 TaxID=1122192 RepID=A0A1T4P9V7_9ACTN|nr:winged helix-turn-helix domain-containing protein [Marinactinospora thermotolerans]SJZ88355.1 Helix-turn-helix domain-containing protein [Marinactinospora thermotolerans DSM 45154]
MSEDEKTSRARAGLARHPVRAALLELLEEAGTVTATEAARRIGASSGLCSFHLRRLAEHGVVEEVPNAPGRSRPWRLRAGRHTTPAPGEEFGSLERGLEDASWRHWLAHRDQAPHGWGEEAFSAVVYLTPEEMGEVATAVRALLARYQDREWRPSARPEGAAPVAAITRIFPLLSSGDTARRHSDTSPGPAA